MKKLRKIKYKIPNKVNFGSGNWVISNNPITPFLTTTYTATEGQTEFTATYKINRVYVDNIYQTSGFTGQGTKAITFESGRSAGEEVVLTN